MGILSKVASWRWLAPSILIAVMVFTFSACGGGGGSSGSASTGASGGTDGITLVSVTFPQDVDMTQSTVIPPYEAPLSQQIVFNFSGPVTGPITTSSILIYAEAGESYEGPQFLLDPQKNIVRTLGTFEKFSNVVVFRPTIPQKDMNLSFNALPEEIPGLLPETTYQIYVPIGTSGSIPNLVAVQPGVPNPVFITTTKIPQLYFNNFHDQAPEVVDTHPKNGRVDFPLNTLSPNPDYEDMWLSFDQPLFPDALNVRGSDSDGDGLIELNLFLRFSDTRLYSATDAYKGLFRLDWNDPAKDALETYMPVKYNGQGVALDDIALNHAGRMVGLSEGVLYDVDYQTDTPPVELSLLHDAQMPQLKGLAWSPDGTFFSVNLATGQLVFMDVMQKETEERGSLFKGHTAKDLVFRHNGELYILRAEGQKSAVERIDPATGDLLAGVADVNGDFSSMDFLDRRTLCLFEETNRTVWTLDLESGALTEMGQIVQLNEGKVDLATLFYEWETDGTMVENTFFGSTVSINPRGVMPFGREMEIMVRNRLMNIRGSSRSSKDETQLALAMQCMAVFTTFDPGTDALDDAFVELFEDKVFEGNAQEFGEARAVWHFQDTDGLPPDYQHLVATFGLGGSGELGDFIPLGIIPVLILDTDYQQLPLYDGSTPEVTVPIVVEDGWFNFRNIFIPWTVTVYARGSNPLVFTATGDVTIQGTIDVSGEEGQHDYAFDSGFIPNSGGLGGCGGGRGGMSQPPMPPNFQSVAQLVTPITGEDGWGPSDAAKIGGRGGQTGAVHGVPYKGAGVSVKSRGAGGGGGTMQQTGTHGQKGKGEWIPDGKGGSVAGLAQGGDPGQTVFVDSNPDNNFFGPDGEYPHLMGGQGGGGAGCRFDSVNPNAYKQTPPGMPLCMWEAKGGGGGGGGGALAINALGTITVTETGRILARGGVGGRGEQTKSANYGGAAGSGSGGVVILQAGTAIVLEESTNPDPDAKGAWIEVSGGDMGDAKETVSSSSDGPDITCPFDKNPAPLYCSLSRGDGGAGGFGIIQLMVNDPANNLTPPPEDLADAKVFVGAYVHDADPNTGDRDYSPKGFVYYERWYLTYDPGEYPMEFVWGEETVEPLPEVTKYVVPRPPLVDPYKTVSYLSPVSYGLSKWIDLGATVHRPEVDLGGGMMMKAPAFFGFKGTDPQTGIVILENGFVVDHDLPGVNDIEVMAPDLAVYHYIPEDNEVAVEFQGAHPAAPGLSIPGEDQSAWTADLNQLSGYQLIRYRVRLNVSKSSNLHLGNTRPQVDKIRLRTRY